MSRSSVRIGSVAPKIPDALHPGILLFHSSLFTFHFCVQSPSIFACRQINPERLAMPFTLSYYIRRSAGRTVPTGQHHVAVCDDFVVAAQRSRSAVASIIRLEQGAGDTLFPGICFSRGICALCAAGDDFRCFFRKVGSQIFNLHTSGTNDRNAHNKPHFCLIDRTIHFDFQYTLILSKIKTRLVIL